MRCFLWVRDATRAIVKTLLCSQQVNGDIEYDIDQCTVVGFDYRRVH